MHGSRKEAHTSVVLGLTTNDGAKFGLLYIVHESVVNFDLSVIYTSKQSTYNIDNPVSRNTAPVVFLPKTFYVLDDNGNILRK